MKLELAQKQTTGLFMTTEMKQAINLLQYTTAEVWDYIWEVVESNPMIAFDPPGSMSSIMSSRNDDAYIDRIDQLAADAANWREDLIEQIRWLEREEKKKKILRFLAESLDDKGFLTISEEEAAMILAVDVEAVSSARRQLMHMEPFGAGCFHFQEFLLLQIEETYPEDHLLYQLTADHLEDLAGRNWELLQTVGVSEVEAERALAILRELQPRPLIQTKVQPREAALPDLYVEKKDHGLLLRDPYSFQKHIHWDGILSRMHEEEEEAKLFLEDCFQQARWLMRGIEQRQHTLMRVAGIVMKHQKRYFSGEPLQPLTLRQVADRMGVHESTVSRAVAGKVIQTPLGMKQLKSFFVKGYESQVGEAYSSLQIKDILCDWIKEENSSRPLSDQRLADKLRDTFHVDISRRTVAKYRDGMGIPSSSRRKT